MSTSCRSAPSAIATVGGGFGGQIGFEITDFVFILNDAAAVRTFSQVGSLTLGGNVSVAAGPVGRSAEAAGAASLKGVSGIFAYSRTKGLFAGVSLEGSGFVERKDANEKMYHRRVTARELLSGNIPVPPEAEPLMSILRSRVFSGGSARTETDGVYNDIPVYGDNDDVVWQGREGSAYGEGQRKPNRASTWQDDVYDRPSYGAGAGAGAAVASAGSRGSISRANPSETFDRLDSSRGRSNSYGPQDDYVYSDKPRPGRPTAPKPSFIASQATAAGRAGPGQAVAKFTFEADQPGDLGFKKGDIITIVKKTESAADWWTGRIGQREGIFPSNYVEVA